MAYTAVEDVLGAAWWPELLAVKDQLGWVALVRRFGVPEALLRRALAASGHAKAPGRPGRKRRGAEAPRLSSVRSLAPDPIAPFLDELGKVGDGSIAARAGVTRWQVARYRLDRGIAAYAGFRFPSKGASDTGAAAGGPPSGAEDVSGAEDAAGAGAPEPAPAGAMSPPAPPPRRRAPSARAARRGVALQVWLVVGARAGGDLRFAVLAPDLAAAAGAAVRAAAAMAGGAATVHRVEWIAPLLG